MPDIKLFRLAPTGAVELSGQSAQVEKTLQTLFEKNLEVFVKVDPATLTLEKGFTRDVSDIGHFGTGELEITLMTMADFEKAQPLMVRSYEGA